MNIAILSPSDRSFIHFFLDTEIENLPIGYVGAPFIGTLIEVMLKKKHKVTAITTTVAIDNNYEIKRFTKGDFTWIVIPSRPHSFRMNGNKIGRIVDMGSYEIRKITKVVQELKPDIVHAHWSYEFAAAAIKSGYPFLVTVHDNAFLVFKFFKNMYRFIRLIMAEYNLRRIRFASTVSPYMKSYVESKVNNVRVIPNPVNITMNLDDIKFTLNAKIATLDSPKIIMINNGWNAIKNGNAGLLAFKKIQKVMPNASLHLYGGGSELNGLAYYDALKINIKNVFFYGVVSNSLLVETLKESHLLIHPALEESFGVVLIEAQAYGVPVVGGIDSGAVPWVIDNKSLLVDVNDPEKIAACAIKLLSKVELYSEAVLSGYNNTSSRFSANKIVENYIDYYNFIIKESL